MKLLQIILLYKFRPIKQKTRIAYLCRICLYFLSPETKKLLGCTKKDVHQNKDGENIPKLESVEVALLHCNSVNNSYQQAS